MDVCKYPQGIMLESLNSNNCANHPCEKQYDMIDRDCHYVVVSNFVLIQMFKLINFYLLDLKETSIFIRPNAIILIRYHSIKKSSKGISFTCGFFKSSLALRAHKKK